MRRVVIQVSTWRWVEREVRLKTPPVGWRRRPWLVMMWWVARSELVSCEVEVRAGDEG